MNKVNKNKFLILGEPSPYRFIYFLVCIIGLISFFLPWVSAGFLGNFSGFRIIKLMLNLGVWQSLFLGLIPLIFGFLAVKTILSIKTISGILIKIMEVVLILVVSLPFIYIIQRTMKRPNANLEFSHFVDFFCYGFVLTLLCCIFLVLSPIQRKKL